jgi:hypothetical protein
MMHKINPELHELDLGVLDHKIHVYTGSEDGFINKYYDTGGKPLEHHAHKAGEEMKGYTSPIVKTRDGHDCVVIHLPGDVYKHPCKIVFHCMKSIDKVLRNLGAETDGMSELHCILVKSVCKKMFQYFNIKSVNPGNPY